jgi:hypothetical protein
MPALLKLSQRFSSTLDADPRRSMAMPEQW